MVLTVATKPSATSTSTMKVPISLIGSSSRTLRLSIVMPRASLMASAMSAAVMLPNRRSPSPALAASVMTVLLSVAVNSSACDGHAGLARLALFFATAELDDLARRRGLGQLARDQVVARIAAGHVGELALVAEVLDVLEQDDLHRGPPQRLT